jgi:hypothetical protein
MKRLAIAVLILSVLALATEKEKALYKIIRLSPTQVGISCLNGADPTGRKIGDVVIMSCAYSADTAVPSK